MKKASLIAAMLFMLISCQSEKKPINKSVEKVRNLSLELLEGEWLSHDPVDKEARNDIFMELRMFDGDMSSSPNHTPQGGFSMKMPGFWFAGKAELNSQGDTLFLIRDQYVDEMVDDYTNSPRNIGDTSYIIIQDLGKKRLTGIFWYYENGMPMSRKLAFK